MVQHRIPDASRPLGGLGVALLSLLLFHCCYHHYILYPSYEIMSSDAQSALKQLKLSDYGSCLSCTFAVI